MSLKLVNSVFWIIVEHKGHYLLGMGLLEYANSWVPPDIVFLAQFQIRDFVKEVQVELLKPGFNSIGFGDCKAPKVLGDIVESIAGAIFLDSGGDNAVVWRVSCSQGIEVIIIPSFLTAI